MASAAGGACARARLLLQLLAGARQGGHVAADARCLLRGRAQLLGQSHHQALEALHLPRCILRLRGAGGAGMEGRALMRCAVRKL